MDVERGVENLPKWAQKHIITLQRRILILESKLEYRDERIEKLEDKLENRLEYKYCYLNDAYLADY